ncbi:hypothetical protein GCM10023189_01590 [Nibrella saemangeumensis]|uniref:Carboxypeptidase regulatory-like domain-containing protein n=1 Tax=Nibrella saemangeumensis TaxID=1084526 RepID=A0ABP8MA28_9BACT
MYYKAILKSLSVVLLTLVFENCQQPIDNLRPDAEAAKTEASAKKPVKTAQVVGPYTVTFISMVQPVGTTNSVFTYTVQRTGPAQGNGLSHIIFSLGECLNSSNVIAATIDGNSFSNLAFSEGKGTGCNPTGSILKFDNLADNISNGQVHTFTFTVNKIVGVADGSIFTKAGRNCYSGTLSTPACVTTYELGGRMEIRYCTQYPTGSGIPGSYGIHIEGIPVLLKQNGQTIMTTQTDCNGYFKFTGIPAGSSYFVVVESTPARSFKYIHVMVDPMTIPSAYYDTHKNNVDFWLDDFMPGECGDPANADNPIPEVNSGFIRLDPFVGSGICGL